MLPHKRLAVLFCILGVLTQPVLAEGPAEFYDRGYAHTPFDKDRETKQWKQKNSGKTKAGTKTAIIEDENENGTIHAERRKQGDSRKSNVMDDSEGIPIFSIGVIVDVNDRTHYNEVTSNLIKTLDRAKIFAGTVYTLASFGPMSTHNYIKLHARGASLQTADELPERFQTVKMSPTYIVRTEEGEILLEAVSDLDRFVNAKGEFLEDPDPLKPRKPNAKGDAF